MIEVIESSSLDPTKIANNICSLLDFSKLLVGLRIAPVSLKILGIDVNKISKLSQLFEHLNFSTCFDFKYLYLVEAFS